MKKLLLITLVAGVSSLSAMTLEEGMKKVRANKGLETLTKRPAVQRAIRITEAKFAALTPDQVTRFKNRVKKMSIEDIKKQIGQRYNEIEKLAQKNREWLQKIRESKTQAAKDRFNKFIENNKTTIMKLQDELNILQPVGPVVPIKTHGGPIKMGV